MATRPRRILPGTVWFVTRRCSERRMFLRPSRAVNDILLFLLAAKAERYGVLVHAYCALSNHIHLVITDVQGRLPDFMRDFDSLVARAVNTSLGRFEGLWADEASYSAVEPLTPAAVLAKIAYVVANPVAAGLVKRGAQWPGLWSDPKKIGGQRLTVAKPEKFFDPDGPLPATAELSLVVPSGFASPEDFRAQLEVEVERLETEAARKLESQGRRFLGATRVLMQNPFSRPAPGEPRFGLKPRVASRDEWKRIEGLQRLGDWEARYAAALEGWRAGMREVLFPSGTWHMRVFHGAACAAAG